MRDDIILNKIAVIERSLRRIAEEYRDDPVRLETFTIQDSVVLNLQRACEAAIDLAMHLVAVRRLGVPQDARSAFDLLQTNALLSPELAKRMKAMVGFRNIAIHDYQQLQLPILQRILADHLGDFRQFTTRILES